MKKVDIDKTPEEVYIDEILHLMLHGKCFLCKRWLLPSGACKFCDKSEKEKLDESL